MSSRIVVSWGERTIDGVTMDGRDLSGSRLLVRRRIDPPMQGVWLNDEPIYDVEIVYDRDGVEVPTVIIGPRTPELEYIYRQLEGD